MQNCALGRALKEATPKGMFSRVGTHCNRWGECDEDDGVAGCKTKDPLHLLVRIIYSFCSLQFGARWVLIISETKRTGERTTVLKAEARHFCFSFFRKPPTDLFRLLQISLRSPTLMLHPHNTHATCDIFGRWHFQKSPKMSPTKLEQH